MHALVKLLIAIIVLATPLLINVYADTQGGRETSLKLEHMLEEYSTQTLNSHLHNQFKQQNWETIAREILYLRHGQDLNESSISYLSKFFESGNRVRDYRRASLLGKYIGSLISVVEKEDLSNANSVKFLKSFVAQMVSQMQEKNVPETEDLEFESVISDVGRGRLSVSQAIELIGYSDIDQSDITSPINNAIAKELRY